MRVVLVLILSLLSPFYAVGEIFLVDATGCHESDEHCIPWKCYEEGSCDEGELETELQELFVDDFKRASKVKKRKKTIRPKASPLREAGEMKRLRRACRMYQMPEISASTTGSLLLQGRKVWAVESVSGWFKVFRQRGPAYVEASCF